MDKSVLHLPVPKWAEKLKGAELETAMIRFRLEIAAAYYGPGATVNAMSEAIGYNGRTLLSGGRMTPTNAIKIEKLLGRDIMPREFLRPDIFQIED